MMRHPNPQAFGEPTMVKNVFDSDISDPKSCRGKQKKKSLMKN